MDRNTQIRDTQNRYIHALQQRPERPLTTTVTQGRVEDGLSCRITQGRHHAVTDLGPAVGGDGAGPTPSFYARAGIVGCVAIGIKMAAARDGLHLRRVDVAVATDFDDGGLFGVGDRGAAPVATRIDIQIDTDADRHTIDALVQRVLAMDPWYLALRDAQRVSTEVRLSESVT